MSVNALRDPYGGKPSAISRQPSESREGRGGCPKDGTKMDDEAGIELILS